jgi:drug/metabolite transporter (DMT)-like permease
MTAQLLPPSQRHPLAGIVLCLVAAASFACNTALASVAYTYGASPLSVLTYRIALATVALFVVLKILHVPITLPPRKRYAALALGVILGAYSYGLLGAIPYMPVALAVLTFYLYPLFVGIASWALGREPMTKALAFSLVVAFIGLTLALNIGHGTLNPIGFAHALGGAILITVLVLLNAKMVGGGDSRPVSLHMLATGFLTYAVCDLIVGEFPLPHGAGGWAAFLAVGLFYSFSIVSMFVAISWIGTVRTALIMNLEPITSVVLGTFVLGQFMSTTQLLGAVIVVGAIVFTAWHKMRKA